MTNAHRIQLPRTLLRSFLSAVAADRSPADAVNLLRQAGYDSGAGLYEMLREWIAEHHGAGGVDSLPVPEFWASFAALWEALQWGTVEHRQLHSAVGELFSSDWLEADAAPERLGCQVTTGLFADLLSRTAGQDVAVLEVECRSRGDARCRFLMGAPLVLDSVFDLLQSGMRLDDALAHLS